jgi:hypothetical protein
MNQVLNKINYIIYYLSLTSTFAILLMESKYDFVVIDDGDLLFYAIFYLIWEGVLTIFSFPLLGKTLNTK